MARLLTCGCEEFFNNASIATTMFNSVGGSVTIGTTGANAHSGSQYLIFPATSGNLRRDLATSVTSGTLFLRVYFNINVAPTADRQVYLSRSTGGTNNFEIDYLNASAKFRLKNLITTTQADTTQTFSTGTWYRMEIRHLVANSGGELELRFYNGDSATVYDAVSILNEDTLGTSAQRHEFLTGITDGGTWWIDDLAINDDSGVFQTTWPGPGKIALLSPNSNVTNDFEDGTSGSSTFANVDDVPSAAPDDDTSFNKENVTLNSVDRFGLTALPSEVPSDASIVLISLYARIGSDQTSAAGLQLQLWDELGFNSAGPTANCNVVGYKVLSTAEHSVYDASGKTKADVASFDAGYKNVTDTATRLRKVTALWVNIEWLEAPKLAFQSGSFVAVNPGYW